MKNTDLNHIKDIVNKYGKDLSDFDLSNKDFTKYNFSEVILPKDKYLFQKIKNSSISYSIFSNIDLSMYELEGVYISGADFSNKVIFTNDTNIFQKIKDKDLSYVSLPQLDYSMYNFVGVNLMGVKFQDKSKISEDRDFFQEIKNKNLNFATLPEGDYSGYDFKDVSMYYTKFGERSLMPKDYSLFKKIAMLKDVSGLNNCANDIHLYDLSDIPYNLRIAGIDDAQSFLIYKRFVEDNKNSRVKITNV